MSTLIGDIGGTHARLALAEAGAPAGVRKLRLAAFTGLAEAVQDFLGGRRVGRVVLAAAGPLEAGRIQLTNRGWLLDAATLGRDLGAPVTLLNDFAALALSLPHLAGRILPRLADALPGSALRARFTAKGRMAAYVAPIPLALILRDEAALLGLAAWARDRA